jgi:hypothetical protein
MTPFNSLRPWFICGVLLSFPGCAVLTESQLNEANRFAKVTEGFSALPGAVIDHQASLEKNIRLLEMSNQILPGHHEGKDEKGIKEARAQAVEEVSTRYLKAQEFYALFKKDQAKLEHSLQFLNIYTKGLKALIATENIEELDKQAESLGKNLDKAINQLKTLGIKTKEGTDLGIVGSATAAAVRGIGGLVLSYHQARYVKEFTTAYHPHIEAADQSVTNIMKALASQKEANEKKIESFLQTQFVTYHHLDSSTVLATDQQTQLNDTIATSAQAVITASNALVKAHNSLLDELKTRHTLKTTIETITVLAGHVDAALTLKQKLDKAS